MSKTMSLLVVEALLCFAFIPLSHSDYSLIESTCQQTPYFEQCLSTFLSDPQSSTMDLHGLAHVAAKSLKDTVNENLSLISVLFEYLKDPNMIKSLQFCVGTYHTILKSGIPGVIRAVDQNNPNLAIDYTRDVGKQVETCEKSFGENKVYSPISDGNSCAQELNVILQSVVTIIL